MPISYLYIIHTVTFLPFRAYNTDNQLIIHPTVVDGTYLLTRTFKEKQNERGKLRGTFHVPDGKVLMLVHPSSGDNKFYKVRNTNHIILIDSFGNEPYGEKANHFVLKK